MGDMIKNIKWTNVILALSVALNFFIAGYFVANGDMFKSLHKKNTHQKRPEIRLVDYLPLKEKREFRRTMINNRQTIAPVQREIFLTQKKILALLNQETIDETQLRQAFKNYQAKNEDLQSTLNEMVIERILKMNFEARHHMFKRGQKAHDRRKLINSKRLKKAEDKRKQKDRKGAREEP